MKKAEKRIYRFTSALLIGMLGIFSLSCVEKVENLPVSDDVFETFEMEGFIVGFNPCTINHQYRIGYVIISNDFLDTVGTYSLSPVEFKIPAPVGLNPNNPLYLIPGQEFRYFRESAYFPEFLYFPDTLIKNYPIKLTYRKASENEYVVNWCTHEIFMGDFSRLWLNSQVIVVRASVN